MKLQRETNDELMTSKQKITEIDLKQSSIERGRSVCEGFLDEFVNRKERPQSKKIFRTLNLSFEQ